jgi:hypothetical protein
MARPFIRAVLVALVAVAASAGPASAYDLGDWPQLNGSCHTIAPTPFTPQVRVCP